MLKNLILLVLTGTLAQESRIPPTEGKYFYADYRAGSQYGVKFIEMKMGYGAEKRKMNVFVTTSQGEIGIITDSCYNPEICDVPAPFTKKKVHLLSYNRYQTSVFRFFDKLQLVSTQLTVQKAYDTFEMSFGKYRRYATFDAEYFAVVDASESFKSIYNGYIGIAPYPDNKEREGRNFLYQLRKHGMIDNLIVSFYVKPG